jgi:hypothetical protein
MCMRVGKLSKHLWRGKKVLRTKQSVLSRMVILSEFNNFYNGGNPLKAERKIGAESKGAEFFYISSQWLES